MRATAAIAAALVIASCGGADVAHGLRVAAPPYAAPFPAPGPAVTLFLSADLSLCAQGLHEVDDGFALSWLLALDRVQLAGIGLSHGNVGAAETAADCARRLVALAGAQVPVYAGAPSAGALGAPNATALAMLNASRDHAGRLWIVTQGTTTDLATAVLLDPTLPERLAGVLVMAGALDEVEGVMPFDPVNALLDMPALDIALSAFPRLVVTPLDMNEDTVFCRRDWQALTQSPWPPARLLHDQAAVWLDAMEPFIGGFYPFDALGLAPLLYPALLQRRAQLRLEPDGDSLGRLAVSNDAARPLADVWLDADVVAFRALLLRDLGVPENVAREAAGAPCPP